MTKADEKRAPVSEEDDGEFLAAHRVKSEQQCCIKPDQPARVIADKRNPSIDAVGALKGVRN